MTLPGPSRKIIVVPVEELAPPEPARHEEPAPPPAPGPEPERSPSRPPVREPEPVR
jgi:hypothetical protein